METLEGPRPLVIAYRGASAAAPEHTIAAYDAAVAQEADLIQLDLRLSADGHLVVIHDERLERTTNGRGWVREYTLQALKRLDAGGWFGRSFRGQRVQTLAECLERFRGQVRFVTELKEGSAVSPGIEERLVSLLQIYGVIAETWVFSFDHHALKKIHEMDPESRTGARIVGRLLDPAALAHPAIRALGLRADLAGEEDVEACREAGLECFVGVVNDAEAARCYARAGATGLLTERPGLIRQALATVAPP